MVICVCRGGSSLPIAHTLCLPETTKKPKSEGGFIRFAAVLWLPSDLEVRAWKEQEEERIMPSLVATTSDLAHTMCVRTHYFRTNYLDPPCLN